MNFLLLLVSRQKVRLRKKRYLQAYFDQKTKIKFICPDPKGSEFDFSQKFDLKMKEDLTLQKDSSIELFVEI